MPEIYDTLTKGLYKIAATDKPQVYSIYPEQLESGSIVAEVGQNIGSLFNKKRDFTNTESGYILGVDNGVAKFYIGDATNYLNWTGSSLVISGSLTVSSGTIGGFTIGATTITATNLTLDSSGQRISLGSGNDIVILDADDATYRLWIGNATAGSAPFSVTKAGAVTASNITITGGSVGSSVVVALGALNVAARGWMQTSIFSVTDADTVSWGSGTFTSADGTAYSISGGNTGNMSAATYVYLDTATSTTAYQTTTTAANAVGAGKVLIAKAQNGTGEATFQVFGGIGGQNIDAASIVANSITANELSTSITYAGSIIVDTAGLIRSGQTAYDTGTGWFIGNVSGTPKLSIGVGGSNTSNITWDGTNLRVNGSVLRLDVFFGDGSDGDVTVAAGTTTLTKDMFYNNLTVNGTLNTGGFRVFCKTSCTVNNGGSIVRPGGAGGHGGQGQDGQILGATSTGGTAGTAGSALASGSLFGSLAGTAGTAGRAGKGGSVGVGEAGLTGFNGGTGASADPSIGEVSAYDGVAGVSGATGGAGAAGAGGTGGAAGSVGTGGSTTAAIAKPRNVTNALMMIDTGHATIQKYKGSASPGGPAGNGGAGGASGNNLASPNDKTGGGSGAGGGNGGSGTSGGIVLISSRTITVASGGTISSIGGAGGNGGQGGAGINGEATDCGGGAGGAGGNGGNGGNGGVIVLIYSTLTETGTISVAGGSGGSLGSGGSKGLSGGGSGTNGVDGSNGVSGLSGLTGTRIDFIV